MRDNHLKGWLAASKRGKRAAEKVEENMGGEEKGGPHSENLVELVQTAFWAEGYYGDAFKGAWGVTQGYPLSPTFF